MGIQSWAQAQGDDGKLKQFFGVYRGSNAVATGGIALTLVALQLVFHMKEQNSGPIENTDMLIPAEVIAAASETRADYFSSARGAEENTIFKQLEFSFGITAVNRKPHDLDWARVVRSLLSSVASKRSPKEIVNIYQARQATAPERKLKGTAVWRRFRRVVTVSLRSA